MVKTKELVETIVKGIQEKKGQKIVVVDMTEMMGAICHYFVVCQGNSPSQVDAGEKPIRTIGREHSLWVAMDYGDVMVHVFVPETRDYYHLENLWEDAKITEIPDLD